jgi:hypothetical protein
MRPTTKQTVRLKRRQALMSATVFLFLLFPGNFCPGLEKATFERDGATVHVSGKILVEAVDGGIILQDRQGKLWPLQPQEIKKRATDDIPYRAMNREELGRALLDELPEGFQIHETAHYLICYNTSKPYAEWCGALFERLMRAFTNFWKRRDLPLTPPEMPLVALIFADKQSYKRYAAQALGDGADSIVGYYNLATNRIVMYDLTGAQNPQRTQDRLRSRAEINRVLSKPQAGRLVATVIHEATHQIAFNCGVQKRLADIPIWLNEGMAMYFETPDLRSSTGWRGMGAVNRERLYQFGSYCKARPTDSLLTLISDGRRIQGSSTDPRFQGPDATLNAYSEAWSLTYYLLKHKQKLFVEYLKFLSQKKPGKRDTSEQRIREFENIFGKIELLEKDFMRQTTRLR